jgi:hypothetical protein
MARLTPYFNTEGMKDEFPFILLGIAEGEEVPLLNLDLIGYARRHDWIIHHLVDSETNEPVNSDGFEGRVPIIPALASYLLRLNEDAAHFFSRLDDVQKGEARRIFQLCLEVIDT